MVKFIPGRFGEGVVRGMKGVAVPLVLHLFASTCTAIAADDKMITIAQQIEAPRVFVLQYGSNTLPRFHLWPNQRLVADDLKYSADRTCSGKDKMGKRSAYIRIFVADGKEEHPFEVKYPTAREGDFVPLFGTICRVGEVISDMAEPGEPARSDDPDVDTTELQLTAVSPAAIGCASVANSLTIPFKGRAHRRGSNWRGHRYTIEVEQIEALATDKPCHLRILSAHIVGPRPDGKRGVSNDLRVALQIGDSFEVPTTYQINQNGQKEVLLPAEEFEVRDIVAPDPARKIMGWVVLQPKMPGWPTPSGKQ